MKIINKNVIAATLSVFVAFGAGFAAPMAALAAGPTGVNLGTAGNFAILAKTGISTTGSTSIVGNLGVSPAAASYITGFALTLPVAGAFSTSALVTGNIYAPGYADPTPSMLTTAVSDMQTAYTDAAGRTNPTATELGAGNIGGLTLAPGLYKWGTGVTIPANITLSGGPNDVWIFQIAQNLEVSSGVNVFLSGGAQAKNLFWIVAGQTTIGTTAVMSGNILDKTTIVLNTGARLNGRALAQAAVTLEANTVTVPTSAVSVAVATTVATTTTPLVAVAPTPVSFYTTNPASQASVAQTSANTNAAEQSILNGLLTKLHTLQIEAAQQNFSASVSAFASSSAFGQHVRAIAINLRQGNDGASVATLQQFLIAQNKGPAAQALAHVGATAYFGALTRAALAEFQANVGISPPIGNFGSITRAYLSAHY